MPPIRRLASALAVLAALAAAPGASAAPAPPGVAAPAPPDEDAGARRHLDVIEVNGLVDPTVVDFVGDALRTAEETGAEALVVQLDSTGGTVPAGDVDALAFRLGHARVPVVAWVGPGARAYGPAFSFLQAADVVGVAPNGRVGRALPPVFGGPNPLAARTLDGAEAAAEGVADVTGVEAAGFAGFVGSLDGRPADGRTLSTGAQQLGQDLEVRFAKPGLVARLLHGVASPSVAYLLLVVGLLLLVFEFFTGGVGVAAVVGAASLALAGYGLGVLPTRPLGVALIAAGVLLGALDVQAGSSRLRTVLGVAAVAAGSLVLYDGLAPSVLAVLAVVVGVALFVALALPVTVRVRYSTPVVRRDAMVGEAGTALTGVDPEGVVEVRGGPWRARRVGAAPVAAGEPVRVVGVDGLVLTVEPSGGGLPGPSG